MENAVILHIEKFSDPTIVALWIVIWIISIIFLFIATMHYGEKNEKCKKYLIVGLLLMAMTIGGCSYATPQYMYYTIKVENYKQLEEILKEYDFIREENAKDNIYIVQKRTFNKSG